MTKNKKEQRKRAKGNRNHAMQVGDQLGTTALPLWHMIVWLLVMQIARPVTLLTRSQDTATAASSSSGDPNLGLAYYCCHQPAALQVLRGLPIHALTLLLTAVCDQQQQLACKPSVAVCVSRQQQHPLLLLPLQQTLLPVLLPSAATVCRPCGP